MPEPITDEEEDDKPSANPVVPTEDDTFSDTLVGQETRNPQPLGQEDEGEAMLGSGETREITIRRRGSAAVPSLRLETARRKDGAPDPRPQSYARNPMVVAEADCAAEEAPDAPFESQDKRIMRDLRERRRFPNPRGEAIPLTEDTWGDGLRDIRRSDSSQAAETLRGPRVLEVQAKKYYERVNFDRATSRILKEYKRMTETYLSLHFLGDDLRKLRATVEGPPASPYSGGVFHLLILVPEDYPRRPPGCTFLTRMFHPNISPQGEICLDILGKDWKPVLGISSVLISILALMSDPNVDDPLLPEVAATYVEDRDKYDDIARDMTRKYATAHQSMPEYGKGLPEPLHSPARSLSPSRSSSVSPEAAIHSEEADVRTSSRSQDSTT